MIEKKIKNKVELYKEEKHIKIYVPSFSTLIFVSQGEKMHFIKYLKYIYNKCKEDKSFYISKRTIQYGEDKIYFGESFSVKYPKFGNYLEINKIPAILNLLNCDDAEYCSIISIIKKIKKIRGRK